jgi:glycosyltransferase involved in cell wall biosynthesis
MQNSQNQEPLVSICIPVYNAEKTIGKTITSLINQTYKNIEIIVVDNCSSDSTVKTIQVFNDPRIRLILNNVHFPCAEYNWNRCFQYVNGEFMAIFHADDVYMPDMILRQIEVFKKNLSVGGVFTLANIINENDEIVGEFRLPPDVKGSEPYTYHQIFTLILENGCFLICPSAIIRSNLYIKLAPFRYDQYGSASDLDMWLRAAKCAPIVILDEKLMNYRVSKTQGTYVLNRLRTHETEFFRVMDFHIEQNKSTFGISRDTKNKYDLLRFKDQLICAFNYGYNGDLKNFIIQMKNIPWIKYLKIFHFYGLIFRLMVASIRRQNANPYGLLR